MTMHPGPDRPPIDYDAHRARAARMRAEALNEALARGLAAVRPTPRTLRNLGLATLLAAGAFWAVMLKDPPKTVAAQNAGISVVDMMGSVNLPTAEGGNTY